MVWITRIGISLESCLRVFLKDLCSFSIICILFQFIQVQIPIQCCRKNTKNGCKLFTLDCTRTVNTANCCRRFRTECKHFHSFMEGCPTPQALGLVRYVLKACDPPLERLNSNALGSLWPVSSHWVLSVLISVVFTELFIFFTRTWVCFNPFNMIGIYIRPIFTSRECQRHIYTPVLQTRSLSEVSFILQTLLFLSVLFPHNTCLLYIFCEQKLWWYPHCLEHSHWPQKASAKAVAALPS